MKKLFFSSILIVLTIAILPVKAEVSPVFYESFGKMNLDYIATNGAVKMDGNLDEFFDNPGWTGQNMYYGYKRTTETELFTEFNECALPRFGNTKTDSYIITPSLDLSGGVVVSFKVKSFIRNTNGEPIIENSNMKVEFAGNGSTFSDIFSVTDMDGILKEKTFIIPSGVGTATSKLRFNRITATANNRFFIADILIIKGTGTALDANQINTTQISSFNVNGIVLKSAKPQNVKIYSVTGSLIKTVDIVIGDTPISLEKGMYLVKIATDVQKIIVR